MKPITTWYRQILKNSSLYEYTHFTDGPSTEMKPKGTYGKYAKCHCYLDTSKSPHTVIEIQ
jgi:hypothetical protein